MTRKLRRTATTAGALFLALTACGRDTTERDAPFSFKLDALNFLPDRPCSPMTPIQARRAELALGVLGTFPRHAAIYQGAIDVFGRPIDADPLPPREVYCVSEADRNAVASLTVEADAWRGLVGRSYLDLAFQLGPRHPAIVESVGRHAFEGRPIAEGPVEDTRVLARSVLASFGPAARPWRDVALAQMSSEDSLGTSAAQVAAASGDADAIRQVVDLLLQAIAAEPADEAISITATPRITELAFAVGAAREHARPYVSVIVGLLNREFTIGSHFGALELTPTSMCRVLSAIGGEEAEAALKGPRCQDDWHKRP